MRAAIAIFLLVGTACGSTASETGKSSDTGQDASTNTTSALMTSTTSTSGSDESGGTTRMSTPDVPEPDPNTDNDTDTTGEPASASDYCESIVDSFCEFYLRCGRIDVDSVESCHEPFLESCNAVFEPQYVELEAAGLLSLSVEGLATCEEHLAEVACEQQVFELAGPCRQIWSGRQGAGQGCGLNVEYYVCDGSSMCTIGLDLCGTCETLLEPGDDCTGEDSSCAPEAFCDAGTCRARVPNGGSCTRDDRCMAGSGCVAEVCEGPAFVAPGDACDATHRCPYLTACVGGLCTPTARLGEACSAATPCEAGTCEAGVCEAPGDHGEPCRGSGGCRSGMCIENVCAPRPSACIAR